MRKKRKLLPEEIKKLEGIRTVRERLLEAYIKQSQDDYHLKYVIKMRGRFYTDGEYQYDLYTLGDFFLEENYFFYKVAYWMSYVPGFPKEDFIAWNDKYTLLYYKNRKSEIVDFVKEHWQELR